MIRPMKGICFRGPSSFARVTNREFTRNFSSQRSARRLLASDVSLPASDLRRSPPGSSKNKKFTFSEMPVNTADSATWAIQRQKNNPILKALQNDWIYRSAEQCSVLRRSPHFGPRNCGWWIRQNLRKKWCQGDSSLVKATQGEQVKVSQSESKQIKVNQGGSNQVGAKKDFFVL